MNKEIQGQGNSRFSIVENPLCPNTPTYTVRPKKPLCPLC